MATWPNKRYNRINWRNRPSTATALGATNLNKMDSFCNEVDNALITFDTTKLGLDVANTMLQTLEINTETGIIKATQLDGTVYTWDLNLEKIPVSFSLSEYGVLTMTTDDGTVWTCNVADLIKDYVFDDSETIGFSKEFKTEDDSYHVQAIVKNGSIKEEHLSPDYRGELQSLKNDSETAANNSLTYSKDAKRWAVGDEEYVGSDSDNSKYYSQQSEAQAIRAENAAELAESYASIVPPIFHIDWTTMELIQDSAATGMEFYLDPDTKVLSFEYTV